jgi:chemotaxis signal transduction protein
MVVKKKKSSSKKAAKVDPAKGQADSPDALEAAASAFERALDEFFVSPDDQDRFEASAPDIHLLASEATSGEAVQEYLSFRLSDELFAVSILFIKEIIKPPVFTAVPRTAPVILGVLSLRGTIVPVVDLRLLIGLDESPQTRRSRILIVDADGELIGLLVDEVRHVIRLGDQDIEPPPALFGRTETEHMLGLGRFDGEMFTLIDLLSIVDLERFIDQASGGPGS